MDSLKSACIKATRLANKNDREFIVILSEEPERFGKYDVCSWETWETFYVGASENRILAICSGDGIEDYYAS